MQRADAEGRDPDEELRQVVGRTVLEGVVTGYGMSTDDGQDNIEQPSNAKRSKRDTDGGS